jgi:DNA-binding transcriptional ArsR family regulator
MSSMIERLQTGTATPDEQLRVLDVAGEETDEVLDALSSDTSRAMYRTLFEEPATPSEIADRVDTSVQNVNYHVSNLEAASLIEPIDTRYSQKGNEMTVYGPATDPLVLVGNRDIRSRVQRSLSDVTAGLSVLGLASLFVQWGAERLVDEPNGAGAVGPASTGGTTEHTLTWLVFEVLEPGLLFFVGCLLVLALVVVVTDR